WTYDHLAWRALRDSPWFGAVPTLAAVATATTRIRLGPLVASPTFRHPVPFARELVALDDVSGGRLTLGIGAGATSGWDTTMLGGPAWSPGERTERRDPATLDRIVLTGPQLDGGLTSVEAFRDTAGRYEEVGVTDLVVHWPRPAPPFAGDQATFERTFERIFSG